MQDSWRPKTVFTCLASERARERVSRAIQVVGAEPASVSGGRLRIEDHHLGVHNLVYDLSPWTPGAAAVLTGLIEAHPDLRILLYVPVRADSLEMLPRFAYLPGICTKVQTFSVATFGLLCGLVRSLCSSEIDSPCERMVTRAAPDLPPTTRNVVRLAAATIAGARARGAPSVAGLARHANLSSRTLTRRFTGAGLPPPKEFLDWMVLMYVADGASRSGHPPFTVARNVGCDANVFYRIKTRRLGRAGTLERYSPDLVQSMFIDRCRALSG